MRNPLIVIVPVMVLALLAGCSAGNPTQGSASSVASASVSAAASSVSASADSSEAYQLVVVNLVESPAYKEFEEAVAAFLGDNPAERYANGDFASLRQDADKLKELAGKLPKYDGKNTTAILAYQHAERYAQSVTSSADAFADAKTVEDVEAASTLFGAGYDEMKELTKIVIQLREENE